MSYCESGDRPTPGPFTEFGFEVYILRCKTDTLHDKVSYCISSNSFTKDSFSSRRSRIPITEKGTIEKIVVHCVN
jgi:hypothetical protein